MTEPFGGLSGVVAVIQLFFAIVIGLYFWNMLQNQQGSRNAVVKESHKEKDKLKKMRNFTLTEPLSSLTRPSSFDEGLDRGRNRSSAGGIVQSQSPACDNIWSSGVGKTAAARLVLEDAKKTRFPL